MTTTRVLIADNHPLVRQTLHRVLSQETDIDARATADNRQAVEAALRDRGADIVIISAGYQPTSIDAFLRQQRKCLPGIKLIIMSLHTDRHYVDTAFRMGAAAYLLKSSAYEELPGAVRCVSQKSRYIGRDISGGPQCRQDSWSC